ncbi:MAG TPA: pirin family protein [Planctomycetota bacterium]|nr:pirin family protein [Planctomycetota bacterium]
MKRTVSIRRGAAPHWVGDGFPVRTFFSYGDGSAMSPFLLLDYAPPTHFEPAERPRGVGPHPHRGFETVTIAYQGTIEHRDSAGHGGSIGPGDVQWMTAASGVVHEEMHGREFTHTGGALEMVQLWVNLPARHKMSPPSYQDLRDERIPTVALDGGAASVRVIAGTCLGTRGPARTFTPIELWDVRLAADRSVELPVPTGHNTMLLVQTGRVRLAGPSEVNALELAVLGPEPGELRVEAVAGDARLLLLAGEPIAEPVVGYGPFVMNTRQEIVTAMRDYESGRMGRLD